MNSGKAIKIFAVIAVLFCNIGCDQLSKQVVRNRMNFHETIPVGKYVVLTRTENSGAFLSVGNTLTGPLKSFFLIFFPVVIMIILASYLIRITKISLPTIIGICFVVGGGVGNLYDRIVYGSVTDFMHIDFGVFRTGIFNMADVSIMTGIAIILVDSIFAKKTIGQQV